MEPAGQPGRQGSIPPDDERLARCGFAKLKGDGIEHFMRKYEITIGRTSKNSNLDVILDSGTISRQHAAIRYNFETKCFELLVQGKNGVQVESIGNGAPHLYTPDSPPTPLRSRDLIIMGDKRFYFLLPRAMGGQSRKRRRLEPSPAPGAVTSSVQPLAAPAVGASATVPSTQPYVQTGVTQALTAPQPQPTQPPPCPPAGHPASASTAAAAGPTHVVTLGGGEVPPAPAATAVPEAQQQRDLAHEQRQQEDAYHHPDGPGGDGGAGSTGLQMQQFESLQDEEDALINAGGMPYDNGAPYDYGTGNNAFAGGF